MTTDVERGYVDLYASTFEYDYHDVGHAIGECTICESVVAMIYARHTESGRIEYETNCEHIDGEKL